MSALLRFLANRSREFVLTASAAIVVLLTLVDYLTGPDLRFFIVYWPPIAAVAWYVSRRWGYVFVALSGLGWFVANVPEQLGAGNTHVAAWNTAANLASFFLLATLLGRLRSLVERERQTARTDFTTGVPNSRSFIESLEGALAAARRSRIPFTLAYMDIDNFKAINDRLGHTAGDLLLRAVAQKIRGALRTTDVVARLGGDEFAVLFPGTDEAHARIAVGRVRLAVGELIASHGWPISVSSGVVSYTHGDVSGDEAIGQADALMYAAKAAASGGVSFALGVRGRRGP